MAMNRHKRRFRQAGGAEPELAEQGVACSSRAAGAYIWRYANQELPYLAVWGFFLFDFTAYPQLTHLPLIFMQVVNAHFCARW